MAVTMTKEEKIAIIEHNLSKEIDRMEVTLRHNIGNDNAAFFIVPIREALQKIEDDLTK